MKFYLGTDRITWLWSEEFAEVPLFLSHNEMKRRVSAFPRATTAYAVDSGAFTHLLKHGRWTETPEDYVAALRRYWDQIGPFDFAGQQDSLTAPPILDRIEAVTGERPTVEELQRDTIENLLALRRLAPDLPIVPTLQGDVIEDYLAMIDMWAEAGIDLSAEPIVGCGSLVGKPAAFIDRLVTILDARGLAGRVHAFGVKAQGLTATDGRVASADSAAWSFAGRKRPLPDCTHRAKTCNHCPRFALQWRETILDRIAAHGDTQMGFPI